MKNFFIFLKSDNFKIVSAILLLIGAGVTVGLHYDKSVALMQDRITIPRKEFEAIKNSAINNSDVLFIQDKFFKEEIKRKECEDKLLISASNNKRLLTCQKEL